MIIRRLFVLALLVAAHAAVRAEVLAEGSLRYKGGDWNVADAIAHPHHGDIGVSLSDVPFDREAFMADGKLDFFDLLRHEGNLLTITIDESPGWCLNTMTRTGSSSSSNSSCKKEYFDATTVDTQNPARIAGSIEWGTLDGEHIQVRFDVPALQEQED